MKRTIKLWEIALLIGCLLTLLFGNLFQAEKTVFDLQQHVLRMHILANSDSDADQQLKYQVRDALLASSETLFGSSQPEESREALETTAKAHLHEMETIAQQVVQEQGYSYPVKAELVTMPFTERTYEDLTMPAGTYEAIRITIGAAAGQNWWCVMYPPLCIPVAEDVAVQDDQAKAYFSDAEQDVLYHPERYRVKWKLAEWFKKWTTSEQTDHATSHISDLRTFF